MLLFSWSEAAVTDALHHRGTHRDEDPPSAQCWPNPREIIHIALFSLFGQTNHEALIHCASSSRAGSDKYAHRPQKTTFHIKIYYIWHHKTLIDCLEFKCTQMYLWKCGKHVYPRVQTHDYFPCERAHSHGCQSVNISQGQLRHIYMLHLIFFILAAQSEWFDWLSFGIKKVGLLSCLDPRLSE